MTFPLVSLSLELSVDRSGELPRSGQGNQFTSFPITSHELMAPRNAPSLALRLLITGGSSRPPQPLSPHKPSKNPAEADRPRPHRLSSLQRSPEINGGPLAESPKCG